MQISLVVKHLDSRFYARIIYKRNEIVNLHVELLNNFSLNRKSFVFWHGSSDCGPAATHDNIIFKLVRSCRALDPRDTPPR
jgi:hypothetical protein